MFNIKKRDFKKYINQFPDILEKIAHKYNEIENNHDEIFLVLNQYLKKFVFIDSWRVEICAIWDVCRLSLVCAISTYEKRLKGKFKPTDYPNKRLYYERTVEYYAENVIFRAFTILEE